MKEDNVTDMQAHKLADLIVTEWLDAHSDSGAIWQKSYDALRLAKSEASRAVFEEALQIANARWKKTYNVKT